MVRPDKPRIRNVLATPAGRTDGQWVCQPIALGADDSILGQGETSRMAIIGKNCRFRSIIT
jgi:hypothetical protein